MTTEKTFEEIVREARSIADQVKFRADLIANWAGARRDPRLDKETLVVAYAAEVQLLREVLALYERYIDIPPAARLECPLPKRFQSGGT